MNYEPHPLLGLEHPYIIQDVDKCIRSLGGDARIAHIVQDQSENSSATLYHRPDDLLSIPVISGSVATNDLLLKVTVPKLLSCKRKRDGVEVSNTSSHGDGRLSNTNYTASRPSERLRQALEDNIDKFTTEVVGKIVRTHRFRDLPDYVFATSTGPFVQRFYNTLTTFDHDQIKQFWFDSSNPKKPTTEIVPPMRMAPHPISFNYHYNQNPTVRRILNPQTGKIELVNEAMNHKILTPRVSWNTPEVPKKPPTQLVPLNENTWNTQVLVQQLETLFQQRPIWTRRSLLNQIDRDKFGSIFKFAYQYVAYMFRSGPWREALIRLGLDPRVDPAMRIYQTMMFQFESEVEQLFIPRGNTVGNSTARATFRDRKSGRHNTSDTLELGNRSHIFDGRRFGMDGRVWQVCDITDPGLSTILDPTDIRKQCHIKSDGWYHNGTWAKARTICKEKMRAILCEEELNEEYIERLAMVPDNVEERAREHILVVRGDSEHFVNLAEQLRNYISSPEGIRSSGRVTKTGASEAPSVLGAKSAFYARDPRHDPALHDEEEMEVEDDGEEYEVNDEDEDEDDVEDDQSEDEDENGEKALEEDGDMSSSNAEMPESDEDIDDDADLP